MSFREDRRSKRYERGDERRGEYKGEWSKLITDSVDVAFEIFLSAMIRRTSVGKMRWSHVRSETSVPFFLSVAIRFRLEKWGRAKDEAPNYSSKKIVRSENCSLPTPRIPVLYIPPSDRVSNRACKHNKKKNRHITWHPLTIRDKRNNEEYICEIIITERVEKDDER